MKQKKRLFFSILLLFTILSKIFALSESVNGSIILLSQKPEIPYTLSLYYDNKPYDLEYIEGSGFDENFLSKNFSIELSEGNQKEAIQYTIIIKPGYFINNHAYNISTNSYGNYVLDFKPTPIADSSFSEQTFTYNQDDQIMAISSKLILPGRNIPQTIAKFFMGWDPYMIPEFTPDGFYVSTVVIEYIYNDLSNPGN